MDEAAIIMDRPPGGWSDLVTNDSLHQQLNDKVALLQAEIGALRTEMTGECTVIRSEFRADLEREMRGQTWRLITAMGSFVAFAGLVLALASR